MPSADLYLNDTPITSFGAAVETIEGFEDAPSQEDVVLRVANRAGLQIARNYANVIERHVIVRGILTATSVTERQSQFRRLHLAATTGLVELRLVHEPDKVLYVRGVRCTITPPPPQLLNRYARFEIDFIAYDPYRYAISPTIVAAPQAIAVGCPLGTAPCYPVITIYGAATNPTLTYRKADGTSVRTMAFTITLAAADSLVIDCAAMTIVKTVSGTPSSAVDVLTSGDFPVLDPLDGDWFWGSWPTLETSLGTLGATYRRAYL